MYLCSDVEWWTSFSFKLWTKLFMVQIFAYLKLLWLWLTSSWSQEIFKPHCRLQVQYFPVFLRNLSRSNSKYRWTRVFSTSSCGKKLLKKEIFHQSCLFALICGCRFSMKDKRSTEMILVKKCNCTEHNSSNCSRKVSSIGSRILLKKLKWKR